MQRIIPIVACTILCVVLIPGCSFPGDETAADFKPSSPVIAADIVTLMEATADSAHACSQAVSDLLARTTVPFDTPVYGPLVAILKAECRRLRAEPDSAVYLYHEIVSYAERTAPGDYFASCMAVFAAWRLFETHMPDDSADAADIVALADRIRTSRPARDLARETLSGSLPQLNRELLVLEIRRSLVSGVDSTAGRLYIAWLKTGAETDLGQCETVLADTAIRYGFIDRTGLDILRGKRFVATDRSAEAVPLFRTIFETGDPGVSAEAGFLLVDALERSGESRRSRIAVLDRLAASLNPRTAARALFERAMVNRSKVTAFTADCKKLIANYPASEYTDNAMYELAYYFVAKGDIDSGIAWFARLRSHPHENSRFGMAHYIPACTLLEKGRSTEADSLFVAMSRFESDDQLALIGHFWHGRIAEASGDSIIARESFGIVAKADPVGYYGIRARMHFACGSNAAAMFWPDPGTDAFISERYVSSPPIGVIPPASPAACFADTVLCDIYRTLVDAEYGFRTQFPSQRRETLSLAEMDGTGMLVRHFLLQSLRRTAVASARECDPAGAVRLASIIGESCGDYVTALGIATWAGEAGGAANEPSGYLRAAYPPAYTTPIRAAAEKYGLHPELVYAVMRRESTFQPTALSPRGAVGLFQFIPPTFDTLNRRWKLLPESGASSREEFLLDPELSIDLGARWFAQELLPRHKGDMALAIMEHNAGYPAVRRWVRQWTESNVIGDIEFMVETVGYTETRFFARRVLTDMAVIRGAGLFPRAEPSGTTDG